VPGSGRELGLQALDRIGIRAAPRGPDVLAAADILVQPGKAGEFNDYRFPSKLPEFLAIVRPVILPASNIALQMTHGVDAYVLPKVDAVAIVEAVVKITDDSDLYDRLARRRERNNEKALWRYYFSKYDTSSVFSCQRRAWSRIGLPTNFTRPGFMLLGDGQ
jgi:glycosyltransferase involved in cell wall biosynthesis